MTSVDLENWLRSLTTTDLLLIEETFKESSEMLTKCFDSLDNIDDIPKSLLVVAKDDMVVSEKANNEFSARVRVL